MSSKLVPELYCSDIVISRRFYCDVLGFTVLYECPEERFLYLHFQGSELMLEGEVAGQRRWITGDMQQPFGRGINFQWEVTNIEALFHKTQARSASSIYMPLESKTYRCADQLITQQQFIAQDPDGYLFRFCQDVESSLVL